MIVATVAVGTRLSVVRQDVTGARPAVTLPQTFGTALAVVSVAVLVLCALASIGGAIWRTWRARARRQHQQLLLLLVTSAIVIVLTPLNAPAVALSTSVWWRCPPR